MIPDRKIMMLLMAGVAALVVAALTFLLPEGRVAQVILDHPSPHFPYPFTIQNFLHIIFFIGLGELVVRYASGRHELVFIRKGYLPEDEETVLQLRDLGPIRKRVSREFTQEHGFLPHLLDISILQFQASRSVDQTVAVMNSSLELMQHRVDMRYSLIRYIAWLIPTLGFIGTVIGLGASLASAGTSAEVDVKDVARKLAVGFDCTMVALVQSAFLVFLLHIVQEREETALNHAGTYTLRNLVNRLYVGDER